MKMYLIVPKNSSNESALHDMVDIYENAGGGNVVAVLWSEQEAKNYLKLKNHGDDEIYEIRVFNVTPVEA